MEVVLQQAVGEQVSDQGEVFLVEPQEQVVIPFIHEDVLPVHAAVVDVIVSVI